jgi:hypothetical protein
MVEDPAILESLEKMGNSYAYKSVEETQALVAEEDARIENLATTLDITAN